MLILLDEFSSKSFVEIELNNLIQLFRLGDSLLSSLNFVVQNGKSSISKVSQGNYTDTTGPCYDIDCNHTKKVVEKMGWTAGDIEELESSVKVRKAIAP